ncbi:MAG TPA: hypothetical protein VJ715_15340 [Pyrinomonadaceae bacterium]|nr:hypothetical protein [Pyrinomonadaceae bacterium]
MPNLDALDTLIAIVVVILILSLLVQSIQSLIKRLLKLKSKEIEKSLVILFDNIIEKYEPPKTTATPGTPAPPAAVPADNAVTSRQLVGKVLEQFNAAGRSTKFKNPVLESISKEDLLKVLARVESRTFHSGYVEKFEGLYKQVADLEQKINSLVTGDLLQGAASAKFAEMSEVLSPLINDFKAIVSGGSVKRDVLLGDLLALREVKLNDALALLSSAQEAVARDLEAERAAKNDLTVAALQELSKRLAEIARIIGQLGQRADDAFGSLRTQLDHVANWYDTVMQSFEERYNRHMKNVAIYISIGVVIFFNANIFRIYRNISTDDLQRSLIVKAGEKLIEEPSTATNANAAPSTNNNAPGGNATGGAPAQTPTTIEELKQDIEAIRGYSASSQALGFSPLTWGQINRWLSTWSFNNPGSNWWGHRLSDLKTLLGWALTVLLLSVGAPFWQDTLESLFGVKNLLRQKSNTRNVETRSGEGQPRS